MKPIRPLFHNRQGPYDMGRSLYVAFRRWPDEERRQPANEIPSPEGDVSSAAFEDHRKGQPFQERREFRQRTRHEHRQETKPVELERRKVERRFRADRRDVHLPRISTVIQQARERGWLLPEEVKHLRCVIVDSLEKRRYEEWLGSLAFKSNFEEPGWSDKDHYEKYKLFRFASLVDLLRPGELDWGAPDPDDMRLALKLLRAFGPSSDDPNKQRAFIRRLFDPGESLEDLARVRQQGLSLKDREILAKYLHLHGKRLAEALHEAGFDGFHMSPLKKYAENPRSFYTIVSRWRQGNL